MLKGFLIWLAWVILACVVVIGLWSLATESGEWNYKVIVTIETPEGEISGNAVRQVANWTSRFKINFPDAVNKAYVRGEVVAIDMGSKGVLFALLDDTEDIRFTNVFPEGSLRSVKGLQEYKEKLKVGVKAKLSPWEWPGYPKLVTFRSLSDPKSIEIVESWQLDNKTNSMVKVEDNFSKIYGEGFHLKSIEYEITDQKITHNPQQLLPIYANQKDYFKWFSSLPYDSPKRISPANFGRVRH
jgi:hypothetical protein